jgi:hypothetical protein
MKLRLPASIALIFLGIWVILNSCTKEGAAANSTSKAGSLTRFTVEGNYLYAVDNHFLYAYSLSNPSTPSKVFTSPLNYDIETIYSYNNRLFLGTKTGLYIYSIDTAASPRLIGEAKHARSCDPVVVNDSVAFVTLKSGTSCGPAVSGLYIHDIKDLMHPILKKTINLPDPVGLGLQDSILYICCGNDGLKVFNITAPFSPALISTKTDGKFIDVIPYNQNLICFVEDGVILYNITNPASPTLLKKITN